MLSINLINAIGRLNVSFWHKAGLFDLSLNVNRTSVSRSSGSTSALR